MTRILALLCLLVLPLTASAAPRPGLEAGGSWVWLGEDFANDDSHPGGRVDFSAAGTLTFEFESAWSFVTGLRYSRLGNEVEIDGVRTATEPYGNGIEATSTLRLHYLGIPLLGRWRMRGDAAPFLFGGTEVAYLLEGSGKYELEPSFETGGIGEGEFDITDRLERLNLTAIVGAGVDVRVGEHAFDISIRYAHGLIDTADSSVVDWTTREVAAVVGFRW